MTSAADMTSETLSPQLSCDKEVSKGSSSNCNSLLVKGSQATDSPHSAGQCTWMKFGFASHSPDIFNMTIVVELISPKLQDLQVHTFSSPFFAFTVKLVSFVVTDTFCKAYTTCQTRRPHEPSSILKRQGNIIIM